MTKATKKKRGIRLKRLLVKTRIEYGSIRRLVLDLQRTGLKARGQLRILKFLRRDPKAIFSKEAADYLGRQIKALEGTLWPKKKSIDYDYDWGRPS